MNTRSILIAVLAGLSGFLVGRVTGPAAEYKKVAEDNVILRRDLQLYKYLVEDYEAKAAAPSAAAEPSAATEPQNAAEPKTATEPKTAARAGKEPLTRHRAITVPYFTAPPGHSLPDAPWPRPARLYVVSARHLHHSVHLCQAVSLAVPSLFENSVVSSVVQASAAARRPPSKTFNDNSPAAYYCY